MKKLLKLHDHKHTAKRLEHKHTSYRALYLVIVVFAVSLFAIQSAVNAEDYDVTAKVSATMPSVPAQITNLTNNYQTTSPLLDVSGTCPITVPAIIVQIENNGQNFGSIPCSALGTFNIFITIVNGQNSLVPKIVNITNDVGPIGSAVIVVYTPPSTPVIPPGDNSVTTNTVAPSNRGGDAVPSISAPSPFIIYNPTKVFSWEVELAGGESPYTVTIDWGDGQVQTLTGQVKGKVKISHTYSESKKYQVTLAVTDVLGIKTVQTFAAVTLVGQNGPSLLGTTKNSNGAFSPQNIAMATTSVTILVGGVWLGARTELVHFRPRFKK